MSVFLYLHQAGGGGLFFIFTNLIAEVVASHRLIIGSSWIHDDDELSKTCIYWSFIFHLL